MPGDGPWFSWYFWIPIIGPLIGGVIGVLLYDLFIGDVLHARLLRSGPAAPAAPEAPSRPPGPDTTEPRGERRPRGERGRV
jgi:glycerol uptake facilitator protein